MKRDKHLLKGVGVSIIKCVVIFFAVLAPPLSWAEQPLESFNPNELDEGQKDAYYFSLLPFQIESIIQSSPPAAISISTELYAASKAIPLEDARKYESASTLGEVIVATIDCYASAHYPHIGRSSRTVKAKGEGTCDIIATSDGPLPPEQATVWTMRMLLLRLLPGEDFIGPAVAWGTFSRVGYSVRWSPSATQIDSGECINARYVNSVVVSLDVPPEWSVGPTDNVVAGEGTPRVSITGC